MAKKFCVMTTGRSGSSSFMGALKKFDDIATPNTNFPDQKDELVHPRHITKFKKRYSELLGQPIETNKVLIESFYKYNENTSYAGFKSMPLRHRRDPGFLQREDIQFIVLTRDDIPSTVASFIAARKMDTWNRTGGTPRSKFRTGTLDLLPILGLTLNLRYSSQVLVTIKSKIDVKYEDLCSADFTNSDLNSFFNRTIRLENPVKPTSGEDYITNWDWFKRVVERVSRVS
jgi:hypothetical protein